jgi:hypothetical protein
MGSYFGAGAIVGGRTTWATVGGGVEEEARPLSELS